MVAWHKVQLGLGWPGNQLLRQPTRARRIDTFVGCMYGDLHFPPYTL